MSTKSLKNELQEYCTCRTWGYPIYEMLGTDPEFSVRVVVTRDDNTVIAAEGSGPRKKCAEKAAAGNLLLKLQGAAPAPDGVSSVPEGASEIPMDETQGATPLINQSTASPPSSGKNYRSILSEYCQHHGFKPKYDQLDTTENGHRFSMQLTIENKQVVGGGSNKKEANEEAAKKMWNLIEEESSIPQNEPSLNHYTLINTDPRIGVLDADTTPPIPISDSDPRSESGLMEHFNPNAPLPPPHVGKFKPVIQPPSNLVPIGTDYVEQLEKMLKSGDSEMVISFVLIPTEGMVTDHVFLFINIGKVNEIPTFTGHGKGVTEVEAKNSAAYNLIQLLPDNLKPCKQNKREE